MCIRDRIEAAAGESEAMKMFHFSLIVLVLRWAIAGVPHVTVVGYAGGLAIKNAPAPWHSAHSCY